MEETKQTKSVLVVEDENSLANALADELHGQGFQVLRAKNGQEGVDLALRKHPDIILLDIIMPIMDGMTVMRTIREKDEWGKTVPIILLTNLSSDDEDRMKAIVRDEPSYYLVKSDWTLSQVVDKVKERLGM